MSDLAHVESHKVIPGKVSQSRTGLGLKFAKLRLVDTIKTILKRPECLISLTLSSMSTFSPVKPAKMATWHSDPASNSDKAARLFETIGRYDFTGLGTHKLVHDLHRPWLCTAEGEITVQMS
jgi:hypothetical protein